MQSHSESKQAFCRYRHFNLKFIWVIKVTATAKTDEKVKKTLFHDFKTLWDRQIIQNNLDRGQGDSCNYN